VLELDLLAPNKSSCVEYVNLIRTLSAQLISL